MNKLILEILPEIEATAKKIGRNVDQQNEIRQYTILRCYDYPDTVKRLHAEGKLGGWIYVTAYNCMLVMAGNQVREHKKDIADSNYEDLLEDFKPYLTEADKAWIRVYIECGGKYIEIERVKNIHHETASDRIKLIIEKCKKLKSTLY